MNENFTNEQLDQLAKYFDGRYVKQTECDAHVSKTDERIHEIELNSVKALEKLNITIGILGAIATALLPVAIKIIFGG